MFGLHQLELTALVALRLAMKHKDPYHEHYDDLPGQGLNSQKTKEMTSFADNSAKSPDQSSDDADTAYQAILNRMMSLVFDHDLTNLSHCQTDEDLMDACNVLLQNRECDILFACNLNLTGFTSADIFKLLARSSSSLNVDLLNEVLTQALDILLTVPELTRDFFTNFESLPLMLSAAMFVLTKMNMRGAVTRIVSFAQEMSLGIDMYVVSQGMQRIKELTRESTYRQLMWSAGWSVETTSAEEPD